MTELECDWTSFYNQAQRNEGIDIGEGLQVVTRSYGTINQEVNVVHVNTDTVIASFKVRPVEGFGADKKIYYAVDSAWHDTVFKNQIYKSYKGVFKSFFTLLEEKARNGRLLFWTA